jgi:hypothetical protein
MLAPRPDGVNKHNPASVGHTCATLINNQPSLFRRKCAGSYPRVTCELPFSLGQFAGTRFKLGYHSASWREFLTRWWFLRGGVSEIP